MTALQTHMCLNLPLTPLTGFQLGRMRGGNSSSQHGRMEIRGRKSSMNTNVSIQANFKNKKHPELQMNENQKILQFLNEEIPKLTRGNITVYLAGSFLSVVDSRYKKKYTFTSESDIDIFLRGPHIAHESLGKWLKLSLKFKTLFGRELHVYPVRGMLNEPQIPLPIKLTPKEK